MKTCNYCGNSSGKTDSRGMCVSCGAPLVDQTPRNERYYGDISIVDNFRVDNLRAEQWKKYKRFVENREATIKEARAAYSGQ